MRKFRLAALAMLFIFSVKAQEKQILTSDSVQLYVNVKGKGIPCLYIHGGPGSGSYWMEKFFGDYLEQHFQMVYLDQRGVGRSSSPADKNFSLERIVADFEEVREALGIKQWLTLGHSFGGILQMAYTEQFPASTRGMLMLNCTLSMAESFCNSWIPRASEFLGMEKPAACPDEPNEILAKMITLIQGLRGKDIMWKMSVALAENEHKLDATYSEIPNWNNDFAAVALGMEEFWRDFRKQTVQVKIPVLFFYGHSDWMIGPEHYKGIAFPHMMLRSSNVGHLPFLESRADLEKAISEFLKKYKL
ncbi:MAG TPA: alpha/beta hydrolase [Flavihumibacter sp.]